MTTALAFTPLAAPALLLLAAWLSARVETASPRDATAVLSRAGLVAFLSILPALGIYAVTGSATSPLIGAFGVGLSVTLDAVTLSISMLVGALGAVVLRFSARYLDGDPRHGAFLRWMAVTLAMIHLFATAGNLVQLGLAWIGMGVSLNRLLGLFRDRPDAALAARQRRTLSRAGNACVVAALGLLAVQFGTTDIAGISAMLDAGASAAGLSAVLLVLAALLTSAQLPLHGWLIRIMETPTPVSALLHAGLINAGAILLLRLPEVIAASALAMVMLAVIGVLTALIAGLVALTQPAIKTALAWSTVAQMGFMLLQCGLGLWHLALLHILAHSTYKAHAFLRSGSAVEALRATRTAAPSNAIATAAGLVVSASLVAAVGLGFGVIPGREPQLLALACVFTFGLVPLLAPGLTTPALRVRALAVAVGVAAAYFLLHRLAAGVFSDFPAPIAIGPVGLVFLGLGVVGFALATAVQTIAPGSVAPGWRWLRLHLERGLYLDALVTRALFPRFSPAKRSLT